MAGPEYKDVEKPFIDQLVSQGWEFLAGSVDDPAVTHRESFAQVVMEPLLRQRLRDINLRDGKPWLDEARLDQAVAAPGAAAADGTGTDPHALVPPLTRTACV